MRSIADRGPAIRLRTLSIVAIGAAAVVTGAAVVPDLLGDDPSLPTDVAASAPRRFTITYRVVTGEAETTEVLTVQRPFASRLVVHEGASTKGRVLSERASSLGLLGTSSGARWGRLVVPPAPASADLRPDVALAAAVGSHLVDDLGPATVLGRPCRRYAVGTTVSGGTLTPIKEGERAEVCIDASGLLLEERWTIKGELVRTRRAVALTSGGTEPLDVPAGQPLTGSGLLTRLADNAPVPFAESVTMRVPEGFAHEGRFAVVPPDLSLQDQQTQKESAPKIATVTDVWTRGADLLILDQGAATGADPFAPSEVAAPLDLPGFASARLVLDLRASEVRVRLADGGFVRIAATLPPDELIAIARSLSIVNGASGA